MATGGCETYSDEIVNIKCTSCAEVNKNRDAVKYCVECQGYCCQSCTDMHKGFPALKGHQLLDKSSFKPTGLTSELPTVPTERCAKHNTKVIDMYCGNHDAVGCTTCMSLEHSVSGDSLSDAHHVSQEEFADLLTEVRNVAAHQLRINDELERKLNEQSLVIQQLQATTLKQEEEIKQQKGTMKEPKKTPASVDKTATKNIRSTKQSSRTTRFADNTVAFFATLSQQFMDHLGCHQNIVFENIVTNIGNAYNNRQGDFVAPVNGLYLITTSIVSRQNKEFWAAVTVNCTEIVNLNGHGTDGRHGSGAQTLILQLSKGDDVSVQNLAVDADYWGEKYSSFGGFLIQEFEI